MDEKQIVQNCVKAFDQKVLGFDLLRAGGSSYVCDVNGWSFVKGSNKYYDDCGTLVRQLFLQLFAPKYLELTPNVPSVLPSPRPFSAKTHLLEAYNTKADLKKERHSILPEPDEEVRCVVGVFRHGDRTPKQKMKMTVSHKEFVRLHKKYSSGPHGEAKLKSVSQMVELLEVTTRLLDEAIPEDWSLDEDIPEDIPHAYERRESGGSVQELKLDEKLKRLNLGESPPLASTRKELSRKKASFNEIKLKGVESFEKLLQMKDVLRRWKFHGVNRKLQLKPKKWKVIMPPKGGEHAKGQRDNAVEFTSDDDSSQYSGHELEVVELQLILKWGGELTLQGRQQAEYLGSHFRQLLYPGDAGGLLRLHSTFRHDLKIYCSDEGRVQMTAAAFVKGFLDLEGPLQPILVSLVDKDETATRMLDDTPALARREMDKSKQRLQQLLQRDVDTTDPAFTKQVVAMDQEFLTRAWKNLKNPKKALETMYSLMKDLTREIKDTKEEYIDYLLSQGQQSPPGIHYPSGASVSGGDLSSSAADLRISEPPPPPPTSAVDDSQIGRSDSSGLSKSLSQKNSPKLAPMSHVDSPGSGRNREEKQRVRRRSVPMVIPQNGESWSIMAERWSKLTKDIYSKKTQQFDISKIPDIYDNCKYDILHNQHLQMTGLDKLFAISSNLAMIVVSQEYGMTQDEKQFIGFRVCESLSRKIRDDIRRAQGKVLPY
jgi:inositol hexakisphosphate/diphosphoinositol-pentakisphosphate kinase